MNRFFIAHYTQTTMVQTGMLYPCLTPRSHSPSLGEAAPPAVAFFLTARDRDREVEAWAAQWPGMRFVTGEITAGVECKPGPMKSFSITEKGVLPK